MQSREYWQERFKELEQARHDFAEGVFEDISGLYAEITRAMERDLAEWYQRFADENHMSYATAKKLLDSRELQRFKLDLKTFMDKAKDENLSDAWKKKLENAYVRMRISRIEAVQLMLQQHLEELFAGQLDALDSALKELYTNDYYHTAFTIQQGAGIGSTFMGVDTGKLDSVLSRPWADDGRNFSSRIWSHRDNLVGLLNKEMTQAVIRGDDYQTATTNIARKMNVSRANAGRLVMTEAAFIGTKAQQDCFKNLGVEEFEFVATLDKRTSEICRSMDGKHFKMSDMKIGTNAPPLHPHCRSCTAPYFDDAEDLERIARGDDGKAYTVPGDMTYEQWQEKYAVHQKDKRDIIRVQNPLPNADNVIIPKEKFTQYALNKEHERGKDKARVFESALGFTQDTAEVLIEAIRTKVGQYEAIKTQSDKYGDRYKVYIDVTGPNGNTATVLTAWIVTEGETRLTTAYVKDRPKEKVNT